MSSAPYTRIPTSEREARARHGHSFVDDMDLQNRHQDGQEEEEEEEIDPRFIQPTPPWWQRAGVLIFIVVMTWVAWKLTPVGTKQVDEEFDPSLLWANYH
ncbi:hypothetical protein FRC02_001707 [Tulasnella sp. 418]|nr:hypothetical protein FRC02_001707 [Tulasnella sp. 418]